MNDLITTLAEKAGISPELAALGMGAVLNGLKGALPPDLYAKLHAVVPDATAMVDSTQAAPAAPASGGLMGSLTNLAGRFFGGKAAEALANLTKAGFTHEQISNFLPHVLDHFKGTLSPEVIDEVKTHIPALSKI